MRSFDNVIFTITSFYAKKIRKNNIAERKMKKKDIPCGKGGNNF